MKAPACASLLLALRLYRHEAKGSECKDEILHLLLHHAFLALRRPADVRIGVQAALDEQFPVVGLDQLGAIRASVPFERFVVTDQVFMKIFGISAEITAECVRFTGSPLSPQLC